MTNAWPRWKREARYNALEYSIITRDHTMIGYDWLHVYACMMLLSLTTLFIKYSYSYVIMSYACYTVNDESLEGLKFGDSAKKSIWRKKVWRISPRILVVYNISYILANKVWRNITIRQIRQTLVPPNFRRLR